jgi:hypothetical protein
MSDELSEDSRTVEQAFYQAFEHCSVDEMRAIWLDNDLAACVHPGGPLLRGTRSILSSWASIFSGAMPPRIRHQEIQRIVTGDLAIHTVEELITPGGSIDDPTRIIATNVYQRTDLGWRMLTHHASLPMVVAERPGETVSETVH